MRKRFWRLAGAVALGGCFQLAGCVGGQVAEILADNIRDTAVELGTFFIESLVDQALGLP